MTGHGGHAHGSGHAMHGPRWLTIGIAAVLGIAAVFAGVTTWRAQVMQGHAVEEFTLSTQATNSANSLMQNAERGMSGERQLFLDYQNALAAGNATIATQSLAMMSANSRAAIAWWRAQPTDTRPYSPFVSANPAWNAPGAVIDAKASVEQANEHLTTARDDLGRSHNLEFVAAFLTIAFLAGGLTGTFESDRMRVGLFVVAIVVLVGCLAGTAVFW